MRRKASKTKILGFEYSEDTVYRRLTQEQFEKLLTLLGAPLSLDNFVIDELKPARVSSESEAVAVLYMRNPDGAWLKRQWRKE